MAKDTTPINEAALYDTNEGGAFIIDDAAFRRFTRRLRYRGFKLSPCKEVYYHPKHWLTGGQKGFKSPGDTWFFYDAFQARTQEAKTYLKSLEEV